MVSRKDFELFTNKELWALHRTTRKMRTPKVKRAIRSEIKYRKRTEPDFRKKYKTILKKHKI